MLLKPAPLMIKKKGDLEQLFKDWEDYVSGFTTFLKATGVAGVHDSPEISGTSCQACVKSKNMLLLVGGEEVKTLFDHVGCVQDTDSWQDSLDKVSRGIKRQTDSRVAMLEKIYTFRRVPWKES